MFGLHHTSEDLTSIADKVIGDWRQTLSPGSLWSTGEGIKIDLSHKSGRFELFLYALLSGAKVSTPVLDRTFQELKKRGLTDLARLAVAHPKDKDAVLHILTTHYRALTSRNRKAEALFDAAKRVCDRYRGDIGLVPSLTDGSTETLLAELRSFKGILLRALWFCREMKLAEVWLDIGNEACLAVDDELKAPLWYLGFVGGGTLFLKEVTTGECLDAIYRYFTGNPFPLLVKGRNLCRLGDSELCKSKCGVYTSCQIRFHKTAGCF